MPSYTQEQIEQAKEWLESGDEYDKDYATCILATMSTAERERDEAQGIADQMCDEFQRIKIHMAGRDAEIAALCDRAMLKLKQTVPIIVRAEKSDAERDALRAQVAELEARLQGAADRVVEYMHDLWDGWSDEELRAAIMAEPPKVEL